MKPELNDLIRELFDKSILIKCYTLEFPNNRPTLRCKDLSIHATELSNTNSTITIFSDCIATYGKTWITNKEIEAIHTIQNVLD